MRSGRGLSAAASAAAAADAAAAAKALPAATLVAPVSPGSWRGVVRLGLVELVAAEAPVDAGAKGPGEGLGPRAGGLPETLRRDVGRLAAAQHEFQRLLVTAACLLVVRQARVGAAQPVRPTRSPAWKSALLACVALQGRALIERSSVVH